jgi:cytochrome c oxidase subunit 1
VNRRLWDGGASYQFAEPVLFMNTMMSHAAFTLGFFQLFFIVNLFISIRRGRVTDANPWQATTLEWATPTPPLAHGNFEQAPRAYRSAYEYSVPGAAADFTPQNMAD